MTPPPTESERILASLVVVVDTREQCPYDFPSSIRGTLPTGDYSVQGMEGRVCVERKSLSDLYGSLGHGRDRFRREWERMAEMERAAVVVEASLHDVRCSPPAYSSMHPRAVVHTLISWHARYGVPVIYAGSRKYGKQYTGYFLAQCFRHLLEK